MALLQSQLFQCLLALMLGLVTLSSLKSTWSPESTCWKGWPLNLPSLPWPQHTPYTLVPLEAPMHSLGSSW